MKSTKIYIDDVLIWGRTIEEHDQRLQAALESTRAAGLKLNKNINSV